MSSSILAPGELVTSGIELSPQEFQRVRALIHRVAGIALVESKHTMVRSRLARRVESLGLRSFGAYLDRIESGQDGELQVFINALTTNLTSFYREQYHFPILEQFLSSMPGAGDVRIWCGAASTGEEPYSVAMTAARTLGTRRRFHVLATDIDTNVLEVARRGVYPLESIEQVPLSDRRAYLMRGAGASAGKVRVRRELAAHVTFEPFNLIDAQWRHDTQFDAVFLRNVLIYFDLDTRLAILRRLHSAIRAGGLLFIGHSESFGDSGGLFRLEGRTVYRRLDGARDAA